jgi:small subunit ribosomal protein S17
MAARRAKRAERSASVEGKVKIKGSRKILTGQVVSDKMDKTIVVAVNRRKLHSLYHKYMTVTKKLKAHDEQNQARIGDTVRVMEFVEKAK